MQAVWPDGVAYDQTACMDLTPNIPGLIAGRPQVQELMQGSSTLACMGSRALLSLFVCAAPFPDSLVGAVTTEAEALARIAQHRPTFLFVTDALEQGSGLSLVRQAHRLQPELRTLLILNTDNQELAKQAIELGCNGVVIEHRLAEGAMVQAIRAVVGGGVYIDPFTLGALRSSSRCRSSSLGARVVAPAEAVGVASIPTRLGTIPGARTATSRLDSSRSRSNEPDGKSGANVAAIVALAAAGGSPSRTSASS